MKKALVLVLAMMLIAMAFAGCSAKTGEPAAAETEKATSDELYIGVYCLGSLEYFYDHKAGLEAAGKMMGVKTKYVGPADRDIAAMVDAFEQAIAEEPAGIIAFGADSSLTAVINKAEAAGIPVVLVDGDLSNSNRSSFAGTGGYAACYQAGLKLGEALNGKGQVALLTTADVEMYVERLNGYKDALAQWPDIEIVAIGDDKSDNVEAAAVSAAILQEYPELAGIGCTDATGGSAAGTAVKEAGRQGEVAIIAMDRDQDVLDKIMSDEIYGTMVQNTALMPVYALMTCYAINHLDVDISKDNAAAGVSYAPNNIDTGAIFVDKTTAEYFMRN